jgi:trans-aconitate methyltransferase
MEEATIRLVFPVRLGLAVELGCGTGHTTRLLASVLGPRRALGLDQSASLVARPACCSAGSCSAT